jgi:hypothetical protein
VVTFASSVAGLIDIPLVANYNVTDAVVLDSTTPTPLTLATGDLTSSVKLGDYKLIKTGMSDQLCFIYYNVIGLNVLLQSKQVVVLSTMNITVDLVNG